MLLKPLITLGMALAFNIPTLYAQAQTPSTLVAAVQANTLRYPQQIHSMICDITTTTTLDNAFLQENNIPQNAMPSVQVEQGRSTIKGNNVITESQLVVGNAATLNMDIKRINLFDGDNTYNIQVQNGGFADHVGHTLTSGNRGHGGGVSYWSPLHFGYKFSNKWLSDVLSNNNPTLERVGTDPAFGQLYLVHLNIGKREEHIWFAPKYGNVAVKILEGQVNNGALWVGSHYKRVGDFWMPLQGEWQLIVTRPNQPTVVQVDSKFVFSNIQINNVSDEAFNFRWPTGATLYDNDTRTKYFRDASGKWVKRMDIAEEIAHTPSRVSAADFAPWAFLVSLAALLTLGVLRWRRRTSA